MAWIATGAVVGGVISAFSSNSSAKKAAAAQEQSAMLSYLSSMEASNVAREELGFAKDQRDQWDDTFGPVQSNLAEYYGNLNPDDESTLKIQEMQKGYQEYDQQLNVALEQRGMNESGLGAELTSQLMYQNEMEKAGVRATSDQDVAQRQQSFLSLGMGVQPGLNAGVQGAYGSNINAQQGMANSANNQYNMASNNFNQANQSFVDSIGAIGKGAGLLAQQFQKSAVVPYDQQQGFVGPQRS